MTNFIKREGLDYRYKSVYVTDEWEDGSETLCKKYTNNVNGTDCNPYYFIRLAEVYLIKAEAEARLNNLSESRKCLSVVTNRAGYKPNYTNQIENKDLLLQIFRHKYIELSAENNEEWFDMVRYNCLDGIDFVSYGYLRSFAHKNLPIPYDALAGNAKLIQNPSYIFSNKD